MYKVYNILAGETLDSIARKFNTTIEMLKQINEISTISPGMSIIVPRNNNNNNDNFTTYIVQKGDNLYEISRRFNVNLDILRDINGLEVDEYIYPGQELIIPRDDIDLYIVKDGETLQEIAKKTGIAEADLINSNEKIYLLPRQLIVYKKKETF